MKGDFAKAYEAGRQAYQDQQSNRSSLGRSSWGYIFIVLIIAVAVVIDMEHWLPWHLALLLCIPVVLAYGIVKGVLLRRKAQPPKEQDS